MTCDSNDETNFPHKLILTDRKVLKPCKAFASKSWTTIRLSKLSCLK